MIEICVGFDNLDDILVIFGLDVVYVGLFDLLLVFGCCLIFDDVDLFVVEVIELIVVKVKEYGKVVGIYNGIFEIVLKCIVMGY